MWTGVLYATLAHVCLWCFSSTYASMVRAGTELVLLSCRRRSAPATKPAARRVMKRPPPIPLPRQWSEAPVAPRLVPEPAQPPDKPRHKTLYVTPRDGQEGAPHGAKAAEAWLREHLERFGTVLRVHVDHPHMFVTFEKRDDAESVMRESESLPFQVDWNNKKDK